MSKPFVSGDGATYGTITPQGEDNSNVSYTPTGSGGRPLDFKNERPAGNNSAVKQFVCGDDALNSYGSMEPQPNPGNASTVTTVPKGTSTMSPNFNGTNMPGTQNIPASGYSQTWKGGGS